MPGSSRALGLTLSPNPSLRYFLLTYVSNDQTEKEGEVKIGADRVSLLKRDRPGSPICLGLANQGWNNNDQIHAIQLSITGDVS